MCFLTLIFIFLSSNLVLPWKSHNVHLSYTLFICQYSCTGYASVRDLSETERRDMYWYVSHLTVGEKSHQYDQHPVVR